MTRKTPAIILTAVLALAASATAAARPTAAPRTLTIATEVGYAPYEVYAADGKTVQGLDVDLWNALGNDFGASLGLSSTPVYSEIAAVASGQTWIAVLILGGFVFWSYTWLPGQILNASRNLVAYAIDGVAPRQLASVSETRHTPVVAIWVVSIGSIIALYFYVFTTYYSTLTGIFGFILGFIVVSIAAIAFPYRLPEVFESSPVRWRAGGIPVMSIVGTLSLIACVAAAIIYLRDPLAGLQHADGSYYWTRILYNVAILLAGPVIYFVARALNKGRGVDIDRRFKEIPVE